LPRSYEIERRIAAQADDEFERKRLRLKGTLAPASAQQPSVKDCELRGSTEQSSRNCGDCAAWHLVSVDCRVSNVDRSVLLAIAMV
jgi:hypothetical protein